MTERLGGQHRSMAGDGGAIMIRLGQHIWPGHYLSHKPVEDPEKERLKGTEGRRHTHSNFCNGQLLTDCLLLSASFPVRQGEPLSGEIDVLLFGVDTFKASQHRQSEKTGR